MDSLHPGVTESGPGSYAKPAGPSITTPEAVGEANRQGRNCAAVRGGSCAQPTETRWLPARDGPTIDRFEQLEPELSRHWPLDRARFRGTITGVRNGP